MVGGPAARALWAAPAVPWRLQPTAAATAACHLLDRHRRSRRWAFEPWVWEDNGNTRASTEGVVTGYASRQIPVGAVIIDSPWETAYNNLVWDTTRYPNPQEMINQFHASGVKVIIWTTAFVDTDADVYATVKRKCSA
jgi:alpha-glucosidase (family GH31 glycosyl hydrolase)